MNTTNQKNALARWAGHVKVAKRPRSTWPRHNRISVVLTAKQYAEFIAMIPAGKRSTFGRRAILDAMKNNLTK